MFGMGGSEIIVILIVALLFLGPDKLPQAAKQISKGIRDLKRQSRSLQNQIEGDEQIGGAIRDLKSALRGDEAPARPKLKPRLPPALPGAATDAAAEATTAAAGVAIATSPEGAPATPAAADPAAPHTAELANAAPTLTLPPTAGELDPDVPDEGTEDLGALIRPAEGTVAKGSEPKHG